MRHMRHSSHMSSVPKEVKRAGSGWHSSFQYASGDVTRRIPQHTSISPIAIGRCHSSLCLPCLTQHRAICIPLFHLSDVPCDPRLMCSLLDSQNCPSLLCHIKKNKQIQNMYHPLCMTVDILVHICSCWTSYCNLFCSFWVSEMHARGQNIALSFSLCRLC